MFHDTESSEYTNSLCFCFCDLIGSEVRVELKLCRRSVEIDYIRLIDLDFEDGWILNNV